MIIEIWKSDEDDYALTIDDSEVFAAAEKKTARYTEIVDSYEVESITSPEDELFNWINTHQED